jgi:hypothetical protein
MIALWAVFPKGPGAGSERGAAFGLILLASALVWGAVLVVPVFWLSSRRSGRPKPEEVAAEEEDPDDYGG